MQICGACGKEMQWCTCTAQELIAAASDADTEPRRFAYWAVEVPEMWKQAKYTSLAEAERGYDGFQRAYSDKVVWLAAVVEQRTVLAAHKPKSPSDPSSATGAVKETWTTRLTQ